MLYSTFYRYLLTIMFCKEELSLCFTFLYAFIYVSYVLMEFNFILLGYNPMPSVFILFLRLFLLCPWGTLSGWFVYSLNMSLFVLKQILLIWHTRCSRLPAQTQNQQALQEALVIFIVTWGSETKICMLRLLIAAGPHVL